MDSIDGEQRRSDGQPCPALRNLQGNSAEKPPQPAPSPPAPLPSGPPTSDFGATSGRGWRRALPHQPSLECYGSARGRRGSDGKWRLAGFILAGVLFLLTTIGGELACGFGLHGPHCAHRNSIRFFSHPGCGSSLASSSSS